MPRGVVKYIPIPNCPDPNYPATVPNSPSTKSGTPTPPTLPPTGPDVANNYIDQAAAAATNFSNMKVGYFKYDLQNTKSNLYGEAIEKWYYPPVEVKCLIERGEFINSDTEFGVDINQTIKVVIPKITLFNLGFTPEVGDILTDQERYYEVNSIDRSFVTIPGGGTAGSTLGTPGQIILFTLSAYLTRTSRLNIVQYS